MRLSNRIQAGKLLTRQLTHYRNRTDAIVLALPRGGVPVAYEIAKSLNLPLDVFLVRKLGMPYYEEVAMGAIASGGIRIFNEEVLLHHPISEVDIEAVAKREEKELKRRSLAYRGNKPLPDLRDKVVILVDDGIATGATMRAAITAIKQQKPQHVIVAVPIAPISVKKDLPQADEIICLIMPEFLGSVGQWYEHFDQISDQEVQELLSQAEFLYKKAA